MHERKRGLRILVVDDNYDGATVLSVLLELMGHRTTTASRPSTRRTASVTTWCCSTWACRSWTVSRRLP